MRFEDLDAFLAVTDAGSFSAAAQALHLTQPAMTRRIQQLESRLQAQLFDRVGKRVHLTDAGRLLEPRARDLLTRLADAKRAIGNLEAEVAGSLKLATSHHIGLHRLAPVLKDFSRRYAGVALDIRFEDSEAAHDLVKRAESELAVVTLDPQGAPGVRSIPLWHDELCFVVAHDHPLAKRDLIELAELADYPAILPGLGTYTGRIVAELFETRQIPLSASLATNYLETISMLVGIGLGWSVLPRSMSERLRILRTTAPVIGRRLGCVTNPQRTLSNAAQAFIAVLGERADPDLRPSFQARGI